MQEQDIADLRRRLKEWLRAETLNGRTIDLVDVAVRYDLTLEQAEGLVAGLPHVITDDGRQLRWLNIDLRC